MAQLKDPLTGNEFIPARSNQKFQVPANRIKFNNEKAKAIRNAKAGFDRPLARNYRILIQLMNGETVKEVHKEFMRGLGFEFRIYTHQVKVGNATAPAYYHYKISTLEGKPEFVRIELINSND